MKQTLLPLLAATVLIGASNTAQAETWECAIIGATQKVILTQESDPALSEEDYVEGTVTGPYGKTHKAEVSIDGFNRRWDYTTADKTREYAVIMSPSGMTHFIDFTGAEKGDSRESSYELECKDLKAEQVLRRKEVDLKAKLQAEENQRSSNTLRESYIMAIQQKVKRNWRKPPGSGKIPECWVRVLQGPGGIILDVTFGNCKGSDAAYRASVENAVFKSDPLPKPGDPSLFRRELNFNFSPD